MVAIVIIAVLTLYVEVIPRLFWCVFGFPSYGYIVSIFANVILVYLVGDKHVVNYCVTGFNRDILVVISTFYLFTSIADYHFDSPSLPDCRLIAVIKS